MVKVYRQKRDDIRAIAFTRENIEKCKELAGDKMRNITIPRTPDGVMTAEIYVSSIPMIFYIKEGEILLKDSSGRCYPCDAEIFHNTFEEID